VIDANASGTTATNYLNDLVYELLDAHLDTIKLADGLSKNPRWAAHLDYLRDLQRIARETLARVAG
jgi:hypothetical protein